MDKVFILEGSFAQQIRRHVKEEFDGNPLWVSSILHTNPNAVIETHLDFLRAGVDIIKTNTYQASVDGFVSYLGLDKKQSYDLIVSAVHLVKQACDIYEKEMEHKAGYKRPLIVGAAGPYGAFLHDFSEYKGDYVDRVDTETMRDWHRPRLQALVEGGVDMIAFETIPAGVEAEMLVELLKEFPKVKAWLSFSTKDTVHISHGEQFQETAIQCWNRNRTQLVAVGVNCLVPRNVGPLLKGINKCGDKSPIPFVVYSNSGEDYDKTKDEWVRGDKYQSIEAFVSEWLDLGVRYIGGCCRTDESDVFKIRVEVDKWIMKSLK